ncbi:DUF2188 domain-containing protein [uncultured Porphyromonas sp.]|uniref:DUF2188 domain-containing protein n=1 Tax=uncultured Porphyromonas sp. TaxID=159274 RepID=UPI0025EB52CF|nr:DUF2188 domain-containing protein [uncultured Porphyromonas sp.]
MDKRKDLHVTHRKSDGKWQILSEGQPKALKLCPTQEEAIQAARDIAIDRGVSVVIHGMDGKIREVYSYDDRKQK